MKYFKTVISSVAPNARDVMWIKPVTGGFALYILDSGKWQPLVPVDDNGTATDADDTPVKPIRTVKVNNTSLTPTSSGIVNVKIETGTANGTVKVNNANVAVKGLVGSGTFAAKPATPAVGDQYFCTDKQTTEGAADGIVIYYNGTNWVDALGRTIS